MSFFVILFRHTFSDTNQTWVFSSFLPNFFDIQSAPSGFTGFLQSSSKRPKHVSFENVQVFSCEFDWIRVGSVAFFSFYSVELIWVVLHRFNKEAASHRATGRGGRRWRGGAGRRRWTPFRRRRWRSRSRGPGRRRRRSAGRAAAADARRSSPADAADAPRSPECRRRRPPANLAASASDRNRIERHQTRLNASNNVHSEFIQRKRKTTIQEIKVKHDMTKENIRIELSRVQE